MNKGNDKPRWDLTVLVILILGSALRFVALNQQSYWVDEIRSVITALGGLESRWAYVILNIHGPLHLVSLKLWMTLVGVGEGATRALSAIFGAAGLWLFYRAALPLVGRRAALVGLALLATSPFYLWYSQETRNYTLLFSMGLLAVPALIAEIEQRSWRAFLAALGTSIAVCLSNLTGLFLLVFYGLYAITFGRRDRYPLWRGILLLLLVAIALSPWVLKATGQLGQLHLGRPDELPGEELVVRGESPAGLLSIPFSFYSFSLGSSMGPSIHELKTHHWSVVTPHLPYLIPALALFGLTALWGVRVARRSPRRFRILLLWLAIPILLMAVLSLLNLKASNPRYAILAFAPYLLLIGIGVASIRNKIPRTILLALLLLISAYADYRYFTNPRYWRPDSRSIGNVLNQEARPGDVLISCGVPEPMEYYAPGELAVLQRPMNVQFGKPETAERWLRRSTSGKERLWYVKINGWWADPQKRLLHACQEFMIPRGEWQFNQAPLHLFDVPPQWRSSEQEWEQKQKPEPVPEPAGPGIEP